MRVAAVVLVALVAAIAPVWDVALASYQVAQLCRAAGLKVYETAHVDGYLTNVGSGAELKEGFSYIELRNSANTLTVFTKAGDKLDKQTINTAQTPYQIKSRYEFKLGNLVPVDGSALIGVSHSLVIDRTTNTKLGESIVYTVLPGWLDRRTTQLVQRYVWLCPNDSGLDAKLLEKTLRPLN